jgi:hypothetical protein
MLLTRGGDNTMNNGVLIYKKFKHIKGSALVYTLIVFMMASIFGTIVISVFNNNLLQTKNQEHHAEAYYLAYSGIEMAFSALIADENDLFNKIKNGNITTLDSRTDPNTDKTDGHILFQTGYIDFIVTRSNETNYVGWIKIVSTGTLKSNNVSYMRTLYIDPSNQKNVVWK